MFFIGCENNINEHPPCSPTSVPRYALSEEALSPVGECWNAGADGFRFCGEAGVFTYAEIKNEITVNNIIKDHML